MGLTYLPIMAGQSSCKDENNAAISIGLTYPPMLKPVHLHDITQLLKPAQRAEEQSAQDGTAIYKPRNE